MCNAAAHDSEKNANYIRNFRSKQLPCQRISCTLYSGIFIETKISFGRTKLAAKAKSFTNHWKCIRIIHSILYWISTIISSKSSTLSPWVIWVIICVAFDGIFLKIKLFQIETVQLTFCIQQTLSRNTCRCTANIRWNQMTLHILLPPWAHQCHVGH